MHYISDITRLAQLWFLKKNEDILHTAELDTQE